MQAQPPTLDQLRTHLAALGIVLDDERLAMLLPAYSGVLHGAQRLATLDLGQMEPAMIFSWPVDRDVREDSR